jgi:hypothetical protein
MNYVEYLDHLPKVDQTIIDEAYWCIQLTPNMYPDPSYPYYKTFNGGTKLIEFVKDYFSPEYSPKIHVVYIGLPVHKDLMRPEAFNYILDPGGDKVYTCFYEENRRSIKEKYIIDTQRWHRIQTDVYHAVLNQSRPRIALTISVPITKL